MHSHFLRWFVWFGYYSSFVYAQMPLALLNSLVFVDPDRSDGLRTVYLLNQKYHCHTAFAMRTFIHFLFTESN